jgi:hemoglobin-like flavoprotein
VWPRVNIQESLHAILEQEGTLADLFYIFFLDRYPEVRDHFRGVNIRHQAMLLTMALLVIERNHSKSYPATQLYLRHLGRKHQKLGITTDLYPKFQEALVATLARFHSRDWNEQLEGQWREAVGQAIDIMIEGYEEPAPV